MKIFSFGKDHAHPISNFGSKDSFFTKMVKHDNTVHLGCVHIGQDGSIGEHEAPVDQLFIVIQGKGWVTGKEGVAYEILPGYAAFWEAGEVHSSRSEQGMTAMILESSGLLPQMNEINWHEQ